MPELSSRRGSAPDRIQRILYLLPAASAKDGVPIGTLSESLGVTPDVILSDLQEVADREYYHRAGSGDRLRVMLEPDRVRVETTGEFRRPPKLTPRERLTLSIGLRVLAAERGPEEAGSLLALATRLEEELDSVPEIEFAPDIAIEEAARDPRQEEGSADPGAPADPAAAADPPAPSEACPVGAPADPRAPAGATDPAASAASLVGALRGLLIEAARKSRRCTINYLKAGADEPETRVLEPYVILASAGRWYAIGRDAGRDGIRAFRLDRMLLATLTDETFERDPEFDLEEWLGGGYVFRPPDGDAGPERAIVRYAPSIARWILERGEGRELVDGSAVIEHTVSDRRWAVRHVLRYGGEAELLGPADLRARVAEGARRAERAHGDPAREPTGSH